MLKRSTLKIVSVTIFLTVAFQVSVAIFFYSQLPPWRKAWIMSRVSLLIDVNPEHFERYLFNVPDDWVGLNEKAPNLTGAPSATAQYSASEVFTQQNNSKYLGTLVLLNDSHTTLELALRRRSELKTNAAEARYGLAAAIGFVPIAPSGYFVRSNKILR